MTSLLRERFVQWHRSHHIERQVYEIYIWRSEIIEFCLNSKSGHLRLQHIQRNIRQQMLITVQQNTSWQLSLAQLSPSLCQSFSVYLALSRFILFYLGLSWFISVDLGLSQSVSVYLSLSRSILVCLSLSRTISDSYYMGLSGTIWDCLGLPRTIWDFQRLSGTLWDYMGLSGSIWDYLGLSGTIWNYMGISGNIWEYLGLSRTILNYLEISETIWDYLGLSWTRVQVIAGGSHLLLFETFSFFCGVPPPKSQTSYQFSCQSSSICISECGTSSWARLQLI